MPTTWNQIYSNVCDILLESGGFTTGTFTAAQFLTIGGEVLTDFLNKVGIVQKLNNIQILYGVNQYQEPDVAGDTSSVLAAQTWLAPSSGYYLDNDNTVWGSFIPNNGQPQRYREDEIPPKNIQLFPTPNINGNEISVVGGGGGYGAICATSNVTDFDIKVSPYSASTGLINSGANLVSSPSDLTNSVWIKYSNPSGAPTITYVSGSGGPLSDPYSTVAGSGATSYVYQLFTVTPGQQMIFWVWTKGSGSPSNTLYVNDETHGAAEIVSNVYTVSSAWSMQYVTFTVPPGCVSIACQCIIASGAFTISVSDCALYALGPSAPAGYGTICGANGNPYLESQNQGYGTWGSAVPSTGNLSILADAVPFSNNPTLTGYLELLPDMLVPYIKYGILAQIFVTDSEVKSLQKAAYCQARYQEGVNFMCAIMGTDYQEG